MADPGVILIIAALLLPLILLITFRILPIDLIYLNTRYNIIGNPNMSSRRLSDAMSSNDMKGAASRLNTNYFPIEDAPTPEIAEERISDVDRELITTALKEAPKRIKPFFRALLMAHELAEVRQACRAISSGGKTDVEPVGRIDPDVAGRINQASTVEEAIGTYLDLLEKVPAREPSEFDLDVAFLHELETASSYLKGRMGKPLSELLKLKMDSYLVLLSIKLNVHSQPALIEVLDLPEGESVPFWILEEIARDPLQGLKSLDGTDLDAVSALSSTGEVERELILLQLRQVHDTYMQKFTTVGPLTRFLVTREVEGRNVIAVLRGMVGGLEWSDVEKVVITEEAV